MWNQVESQVFSNIAANTAGFTQRGGLYGVKAMATFGGGNVALQVLADDGSTWIQAQNFTANGYASIFLPSGTYRFGVTTAAAVYCSVVGIATTQ
jgi:hypothetical protein